MVRALSSPFSIVGTRAAGNEKPTETGRFSTIVCVRGREFAVHERVRPAAKAAAGGA